MENNKGYCGCLTTILIILAIIIGITVFGIYKFIPNDVKSMISDSITVMQEEPVKIYLDENLSYEEKINKIKSIGYNVDENSNILTITKDNNYTLIIDTNKIHYEKIENGITSKIDSPITSINLTKDSKTYKVDMSQLINSSNTK